MRAFRRCEMCQRRGAGTRDPCYPRGYPERILTLRAGWKHEFDAGQSPLCRAGGRAALGRKDWRSGAEKGHSGDGGGHSVHFGINWLCK